MDKLLILFTFAGAAIALTYAFLTTLHVLKYPEGTALMKKISGSIRAGANAFLKRQYCIVLLFFMAVALILGILANTMFSKKTENEEK